MGQAQRRKRGLETLVPQAMPDSGFFLLSNRDGVAVILAAKPTAKGSVEAAVFCVDEWQEGLFQCLGRVYEPASPFQREIAASGGSFRPADPLDCRRRAMWGLSIRRMAGAALPLEFQRWQPLLGAGEEAARLENLYGCPKCGRSLPAEMQKTVLGCVGKDVSCYMVCPECARPKMGDLSVEEAGFPHRRRMQAFLKATAFSLDPKGESGLVMAMPGENYREAIVLSLQKDRDTVFTAALALETWMTRATRPNVSVTDKHVREALEDLLAAHGSRKGLAEGKSREVEWVRKAAREGLDAFAAACAGKLKDAEIGGAGRGALEKVLASVKRHESFLRPRAYIEFVSRFFQ